MISIFWKKHAYDLKNLIKLLAVSNIWTTVFLIEADIGLG